MNHYAVPAEADIQQVMRETAMDRIQAINHLRSRAWMREQSEARGPMIHPAPLPRTVATVEVTTSLGTARICVRRVNPFRWQVFIDGGMLADGSDHAQFPNLLTALEFAGQEAERAAEVDEDEPPEMSVRERFLQLDETNRAAIRARLGA